MAKHRIIAITLIIALAFVIFLFIRNNKTEISENNSIVIIKNNIIQNEELIDEFIEKAIFSNVENQELNIKQDDTNIKVTYTSGEYAKAKASSEKNNEESLNSPNMNSSNKELYGYYTLTINGEIKGEYDLNPYIIKRRTINSMVILYIDTIFPNSSFISEICKYTLESSNYSKKFDLSYNQREDLEIKEVYDATDYSVKTFGGDVEITTNDGSTLKLEEALNNKIITPDDIEEQAKMDYKYGICERGDYLDGGSTEYCYNSDEKKYTILKLKTLNKERDLVIGMSGQILSQYDKNK